MTFPYPPEPAATVANPFVKASTILSVLCTQIDTATGIVAAQRTVGAFPELNASRTSLIWSVSSPAIFLPNGVDNYLLPNGTDTYYGAPA